MRIAQIVVGIVIAALAGWYFWQKGELPSASSGGIEIRITSANRLNRACVINGTVANLTDNHLNELDLENESIAAQVAANGETTSNAILSLDLADGEICSAKVAAVHAGVVKPFISKCDMTGVSEGECQRLVHYKFSLDDGAAAALAQQDKEALAGQAAEAAKAKEAADAAAREKQKRDSEAAQAAKEESARAKEVEEACTKGKGTLRTTSSLPLPNWPNGGNTGPFSFFEPVADQQAVSEGKCTLHMLHNYMLPGQDVPYEVVFLMSDLELADPNTTETSHRWHR